MVSHWNRPRFSRMAGRVEPDALQEVLRKAEANRFAKGCTCSACQGTAVRKCKRQP